MAFSDRALIAKGETEIAGSECVAISFPEFFPLARIACHQMKPRRPIVITGFMGCGKSKIARELARRLNVAMVDLDEDNRTQGTKLRHNSSPKTASPPFARSRPNTLRESLKTERRRVIALGGGAWIEEESRPDRSVRLHQCLAGRSV